MWPSPAGICGRLHAVAEPLLHARVERGELGVGEDRVGEEGAGRPGVVVLGVQDHALAGAQLEDGLAGGGQRDAVAGLDAEGAGGLGVLDGRRESVGVLQLEADAQDDVPLGVGLEAAVPVRERAVGVREGDRLARVPVVGDHLGDGGGDLLAVRAHVLDGGRAGRARGFRRGTRCRRDRPPRCGRRRRSTPRRRPAPGGVPASSKPLVAMTQRGAREALVADDQVRPAADEQQRRPGVVGLADGGDHLGVGGRGEQPGGGTAQPEGGQRGEGGVVEFLHALKTTRRH